jgi:hypothetical protein
VYAHKVFVQSEKVRATYIRVFREAFGDKFGKPEDKFVALGSPKYDKVINSRPEDFTLPADWRALLFKADGGKKKTVFYNTNISAILAEDEAYLQKLRAVLEVFRARAGDALLWWRPHPLNEATYRSMRPRLLGEYERITAEYKQGGWGIFDDTPDLHRAIAWSDAYFGDWSSLVTMCQRAGKPVIIQNVKLTDCTRYLPEAEAQPETERERVFRKDPATLKTESNCCYYERKAARLGDYIDSLIREGETGELSAAVARGVEIARELNAHADGTSGREIYRYVKDLILPGEAGP